MKKALYSTLLVAAAITQAQAGPGGKLKKFTPAQINQVTRLVRHVEPAAQVNTKKTADYGGALERMREKRGPGSANSIQDNIAISTMGESINPFTVIGNGKTNLFGHPALNTISFVRRGGPNDEAGPDGAPGNRLYYDLNTKGGADGEWQISKGPLYKNDEFDLSVNNFGARYPQGLVWSPPGNTDTNQAVVFSQIPVLDGTNEGWGGQARGWQRIDGSAAKQTYTSSALADPYHYIADGMDITPTGKLFFVDPERDVTSGSVVYNNRVTVYRMSYNSASNDWDSTITYIPFNATSIAATAMAFGPDGVTGYITCFAASPDYGVTTNYAPFVSKTVDGGDSWSEFHLVDLNPENSPEVDSLRNQWLGSWVRFRGDGFIEAVEAGSPYSHKVQYSTSFDLDITVDKYNYVHIMTAMVVAGFTDTLEASDPITIRSGFGQWLTDVYLNDPYFPSGFVFDQVQALRGCWGDCAGAENFTEDNRPQTTRSWDGSVLGFCYFDTDTAAYDPVETNENSNPDMWVRLLRVDSAGKFRLSSQSRNKTKGSNAGGQMVCGNVSPYMLPSPTADSSYTIPVSAILLSTFDATTSPWPVTHLYIDGVSVSSKFDSFPVKPRPTVIISNKGVKGNSPALDMVISPNPTKASISAALFVPKGGDAVISITNSLGQTVDRKTIKVAKGDVRIPLNSSGYKAGIYFLNVSLGDQRVSKRFIKE